MLGTDRLSELSASLAVNMISIIAKNLTALRHLERSLEPSHFSHCRMAQKAFSTTGRGACHERGN